MSITLSQFTQGQITFVEQLAKNTRLDPGVIAAWVYQEENGQAALNRQAANNNDWLNVGYTDTATLGAGNQVWSSPTSAANATSNWIAGTWNDPGFGVAAPTIQAILRTAGQSPQAQIQAIQISGWASSRYPNFAQIYGELDPALTKALGAKVATGGIAGGGGSGTVPDGSPKSTYTFHIGGTDNPDEDYWTGINRLAQEVNWYLFSNGEYLYFVDGQEMLDPNVTPGRSTFVLDLNISRAQIRSLRGTYDNTAFEYVADHLRKFRPQRKTRLTTITSPTEIELDVICGIDEIRGGDLMELQNFGLLDGQWIIADRRRSVFDVSSTLTLVPPIQPLSEAGAAGTTGKSPTSTTNVGGAYPVKLTGTLRDHVIQVALAAVQRQATQHAYTYNEVRPVPASLFGAAPVVTDCSGFALLCYKDAGCPDPLEQGYNAATMATVNTDNLVAHGTSVSAPQPGDLIFYRGPQPHANGIGHVAVYLGGGDIANMGSRGEPVRESMTAPGAPVAIRSYL
jgi:hypothetical protein